MLVKLTFFCFLEKDRKFGAYPQKLGLNIFGEFRFGLLSVRFEDIGFHGSNTIVNLVTLTHPAHFLYINLFTQIWFEIRLF